MTLLTAASWSLPLDASNPLTVLGAATVVAALGCRVFGPGRDEIGPSPVVPPARRAGPLRRRRRPCRPEALTDVMYQLADPAVPGRTSWTWWRHHRRRRGTIDKFAAALRTAASRP